MPVYNVTVKDTSTMIQYSGNWGFDQNDPFRASYLQGTFHSTKVPGSSATLRFFGSACYIFGAKRDNHGQYTVKLDGKSQSFNGNAPGDGIFQTPLFSSNQLDLANHELVLTNAGNQDQFVDVDFIVFTTGDGDPSTSDPATNDTFEDTSAAIAYTPSSAWPLPSIILTPYSNNSLHLTSSPQAQARITFSGNAVYVFGTNTPDYGTFTIQIDNGAPIVMQRTAFIPSFQQLLYYVGNLNSTNHTLTMTNQENHNMDLDFYITSSFAKSTNGSDQTHSAETNTKAKTPIIAGAVSGACIGLAWIVAMIIFLRRRKRRRMNFAQKHERERNERQEPVVIPPDPAVMHGERHPGEYQVPVDDDAANQRTPLLPLTTLRSKAAEARQEQNRARRIDQTSAPVSGSGSGSRSGSIYPPSSPEIEPSPGSRPLPQIPQPLNEKLSNSSSAPSLSTGSQDQVHSQSASVANWELRPQYPTEALVSRMQVPHRPQDWGPVAVDDTLPPNYQQATEPFPEHRAP